MSEPHIAYYVNDYIAFCSHQRPISYSARIDGRSGNEVVCTGTGFMEMTLQAMAASEDTINAEMAAIEAQK